MGNIYLNSNLGYRLGDYRSVSLYLRIKIVSMTKLSRLMTLPFVPRAGVSNIQQCLSKIIYKPTYLTQTSGGLGFVELSDYLLDTVRV